MQRKDHSSSNQEATRTCKITLIPRSQRIAAARTSTSGVWSRQTCLSVSETCDYPYQNRWKGFEVTDPSTADCIKLPCSRGRVKRLSFFGKHVSQLQTQLSDPKQGTGSSRVRFYFHFNVTAQIQCLCVSRCAAYLEIELFLRDSGLMTQDSWRRDPTLHVGM